MESDEGKWGSVKSEKSGRRTVVARLRRLARRRLPVLQWAGQYSRAAALADLVAGVTLGLTLVPQSIAYASLANLPVQYGLYSSFIGTMLYVVLGTVKEVSIGPTSLMALLTLQTCAGLPVQFVVLLTFLSGAVVFAMGLLRLGFLVELISPSVTSGFTSATAVIIVVSQAKGLLGISFMAESVLDNVALLWAHAGEARWGDSALALACCSVLLLLRKLKDVPVSAKRGRLRRALFLVSIARNALVVLAASALAYCTRDPTAQHHPYFKLSGRVEPGLPGLSVPPFGMASANGTVSFVEMARRLGSGVVMLPIVMVLANIAIAKAFSKGSRVDATQEMLTLGLCNMAGALVRAMPTCGAFTRSAVSHCSGVRTPLAGLYSGLITLTALAFMTQYFYFIPKACLSSVLICAVIFMIEFERVKTLWRVSKGEVGVVALTFLVSLVGTVELALLCGMLASLGRLLHRLMRPALRLRTYKTGSGEAVVARPALALLYLNAEHVVSKLQRAARGACPRPLLLDCRDLSLLDLAAVEALGRLITKLKADDQRLIIYNASSEILRKLERIPDIDTRLLRTRTPHQALAGGTEGGQREGEGEGAAAPLLAAGEPV